MINKEIFFSFPIPYPRLLVPLSQENADQPDWVLEREERATLHGRAVGAAAERAGERERDTGVVHPAEERRDQKAHGEFVINSDN